MDIIQIPERLMRANSYVIRIGEAYTLIDPGIAPAALDQVLGEDSHLQVKRLVTTHPHYDHIVYADLWREKYNLPLYIHERALDILEDPELNASRIFGREVRYDRRASLLRESAKIRLEDGYYLTTIYLPGHTDADIALTLRHEDGSDPEAIFVGDIFFSDSIGRNDLAGSDPRKQKTSLERLARLLMIWPADTPVYAGHGKPFTVGDVLSRNAFIMAAAETVKMKFGKTPAPARQIDEDVALPRKRTPLIAYVGTDDLKDITIPDALDMDIVNIAFGVIRNGLAHWQPSMEAVDGLARLRAINPDIRLMLSIGGWGAGGFSEMAVSTETRSHFVRSCLRLVHDFGLDGIDLDWEYPGSDAAGIASSPADKENFTLLLQELREALDQIGNRKYLLSIAAGANDGYLERTEMDKLGEILDYVQLMTYDLSPAYGKTTGHHCNLYPSKLYQERVKDSALEQKFRESLGDKADEKWLRFTESSADRTVRDFIEAGVPAEKLVLGAAFYARTFPAVIGNGDGLGMESSEESHAGPVYDVLDEDYLAKNAYRAYWDEDASAPWLFNGESFITYDDPRSLKAKADYVVNEGLAGVMYWVYAAAKKRGLNRVLREALDSHLDK